MELLAQLFGGIIGIKFRNVSNKFLSFILSFASGLICDILVQNKLKSKQSSLLKTGIAVGIGLALHNLPEGLSIRCRL